MRGRVIYADDAPFGRQARNLFDRQARPETEL